MKSALSLTLVVCFVASARPVTRRYFIATDESSLTTLNHERRLDS
jgi:hypothetical protein